MLKHTSATFIIITIQTVHFCILIYLLIFGVLFFTIQHFFKYALRKIYMNLRYIAKIIPFSSTSWIIIFDYQRTGYLFNIVIIMIGRHFYIFSFSNTIAHILHRFSILYYRVYKFYFCIFLFHESIF